MGKLAEGVVGSCVCQALEYFPNPTLRIFGGQLFYRRSFWQVVKSSSGKSKFRVLVLQFCTRPNLDHTNIIFIVIELFKHHYYNMMIFSNASTNLHPHFFAMHIHIELNENDPHPICGNSINVPFFLKTY